MSSEWVREAALSLLNPADGIVLAHCGSYGEWFLHGGQHRTQALLDMGVKRTVVLMEHCPEVARFPLLPDSGRRMVNMESSTPAPADSADRPASSERRGGSRDRIVAALAATPLGGGLAHWGGHRPSLNAVDVVGSPAPTKLPSTD